MPTNRDDKYSQFVDAWEPLFEAHDVQLIPVFDTEETWARMPGFIPQETDMIRSLGFYEAWKAESEFTLTLDDDVRPCGPDIFAEYEAVFDQPSVCSPYFSVGALTTSPLQMRGFPYEHRKPAIAAIQYGGWSGVLDYDAATQLAATPRDDERFCSDVVVPIPRGAAVTTCIMNAAWRTEFAPIMWQFPMLDGRYNRFGDIWSGLLQKKMLDRLGHVMVVNGAASVRHERASSPYTNLEREAPGVSFNERIWQKLTDFDLAKLEFGGGIGDLYRTLTMIAASVFPEAYETHFLRSRDAWLELFGW